MKRIFAMLMALALMLSCAALGEEAQDSRFEGEGFDSPEAAVTAYIGAFKAGDVRGMLSTFAIETYVDNADRLEFSVQSGAFYPAAFSQYPMPNDYMREILISQLWGDLAKSLAWQYMSFTMPEEYGEFGNTYVFKDTENVTEGIQAFYNAFDDTMFDRLDSVELVEFVDIRGLSLYEKYESEANQEAVSRQVNRYGCDELSDVMARIRIDGQEYIQFMQCARYGDRWYNLTRQGNLANFYGLSLYATGLIPADQIE